MTRRPSLFTSISTFVMRGRVIDIGVAVMLSGAISGLVRSLVTDVLAPTVFSQALTEAGVDDISDLTLGAVHYAAFMGNILNLVVLGSCIALIIHWFERARHRALREQELAAAHEAMLSDPNLVTQEKLIEVVERLNDTLKKQS
jgi:large conductance mechanosensitive channel